MTARPRGKFVNAEKPVHVIHVDHIHLDNKAYHDNLNDNPQPRTKTQNVIGKPKIHHHSHRHHTGEKSITVEKNACQANTDNNSKEDCKTAHHRHGPPLQLTGIRVIHDILDLRNPDDTWMNPERQQHCTQKRQDNAKKPDL